MCMKEDCIKYLKYKKILKINLFINENIEKDRDLSQYFSNYNITYFYIEKNITIKSA